MRHSKSQTFDRNYLSQNVRRDVQNIYRGLPENIAVRTAAQMKANMDPRAPYKLKREHRELIQKDPEVSRLKGVRKTLTDKLKLDYGTVKNSQGTNAYFQYKEACRALNSEQKSQELIMAQKMRSEYFQSIHSISLRQQLSAAGTNSYMEEQESLQQVHIFPERTRIANTFFFAPKSEQTDDKEIFQRPTNSDHQRFDSPLFKA